MQAYRWSCEGCERYGEFDHEPPRGFSLFGSQITDHARAAHDTLEMIDGKRICGDRRLIIRGIHGGVAKELVQ